MLAYLEDFAADHIILSRMILAGVERSMLSWNVPAISMGPYSQHGITFAECENVANSTCVSGGQISGGTNDVSGDEMQGGMGEENERRDYDMSQNRERQNQSYDWLGPIRGNVRGKS